MHLPPGDGINIVNIRESRKKDLKVLKGNALTGYRLTDYRVREDSSSHQGTAVNNGRKTYGGVNTSTIHEETAVDKT